MPIVRRGTNMEGRRRDVVFEVLPFDGAPPFIFPTVRTAKDDPEDFGLNVKVQEANDNKDARLPSRGQGDSVGPSDGRADEGDKEEDGAGPGPADKSSGVANLNIEPLWDPGLVYSISDPVKPLSFLSPQPLEVMSFEWVVADEQGKQPALSIKNFTTFIFPADKQYGVNLSPGEGGGHVGKDMYLILRYQLPETLKIQSWAGPVFSVTTSDKISEVRDKLFTRINVEGETALRGGSSEQNPNAPWLTNVDHSNHGTSADNDSGKARPTVAAGDNEISGGVGNNGLSVGAKAGIGVGVSVGFLILLGLLAFFLIRRRRRSARLPRGSAVAYPGSLHATPSDYIRDKETHARVADSPQSPSDDARDSALLQAAATPAGAAAATSAAAAAAVQTPENQSPVQRSMSSAAERTRPEVPTAVAHLVEEGMSDADIRRLEEEERALDQAIEQAARRK